MLQSYKMNKDCISNGKYKCNCEDKFVNGRLMRTCEKNVGDCLANNFTCKFDNNTNDNSKDFCLPYNINNNNLSLDKERNKMINIMQNYRSHQCYIESINNGKL